MKRKQPSPTIPTQCDPPQLLFKCLFAILIEFPSPILELIVNYAILPIQGKFLLQWGTKGSEKSQFQSPHGVATDKEYVYICDRENHRISVFTKKGILHRQWGKKGSGEGEMNRPCGIAVDDQLIFVSEEDNKRVQVFEKQKGTYHRHWALQYCIFDLCVFEDKVFVTLAGNRVRMYNKMGELLTEWGGSGSTNGLFNLAAGITHDTKQIYITDTYNHRVQLFSMEGKYLSHFGIEGKQEGQLYQPRAIVYGGGLLYISSAERIEIFTVKGEFIKTVMTQGRGEGEVERCVMMCYDEGKLVVCDTWNHRIQVLE